MHEERKGSSIAKDRDSWAFGIPMDTIDTKRTAIQDEVRIECDSWADDGIVSTAEPLDNDTESEGLLRAGH